MHRALLLAASTFFAVSVALGTYVFFHHSRLQLLEANLLTRQQLQARLLKNGPLGQCLTPHLSSEVAYVLDPARKRCNLWMSGTDQTYGINSLGLRGAEIERKKPVVRRVVIVG